ncbi:15911_t:CDS:2, partial [Acaulospora colombiana]
PLKMLPNSSSKHKDNKDEKELEISEVLKKWLEPRIGPKLQKGLTVEQAWEDIVKDIAIKALSPLSLNVFANALTRLSNMDHRGRLALVEKLLTISPTPDCATGARADRIREIMIATLSPQDNPNGTTSIEINPNLIDVAETVLAQSHRDWINTREALSTFLKDCTAKFSSDHNVYIIYPHIHDISRNLFFDKEMRTSLEYFFSCIQDVANKKGIKFADLIKPKVLDCEKQTFEELFSKYFPKGLNLLNEDQVGTEEYEKSRRMRLRTPLELRPRWHNQQHMMLLTLQNAPNYTMARTNLIDAALALDEKISDETGLPRCFTGQTPRNSASACLTTNADKYFVQFKKDRSQTSYYKLSFIPNDMNDAIEHYNSWMDRLIEYDWPLCFGKVKKNKQGANLINSGRVTMLSVGASNPLHLRCRRCAPETSCDIKLPSCSRCKSRGYLCIYPLRADVCNERPKIRLRIKDSSNPHNIDSEKAHVGMKSKRKFIIDKFKGRRIANDDLDRTDDIPFSLSEETLAGIDLTGVPRSLDDVVEVRTSSIPNAGNGLFAKRNLPMATPLGFYFGVPMMEDEFDQVKDKVGRASHYSMRYKHTILDATDENGEPFTDPKGVPYCPFHFMNEDPFGNMVFLEGNEVNQVICWTKRDIKKGEELFVYYGGEVDRGHWGQAEGAEEPVACHGDSEEDDIAFSETDFEDDEVLFDDNEQEEEDPGTPINGKRKAPSSAQDTWENVLPLKKRGKGDATSEQDSSADFEETIGQSEDPTSIKQEGPNGTKEIGEDSSEDLLEERSGAVSDSSTTKKKIERLNGKEAEHASDVPSVEDETVKKGRTSRLKKNNYEDDSADADSEQVVSLSSSKKRMIGKRRRR